MTWPIAMFRSFPKTARHRQVTAVSRPWGGTRLKTLLKVLISPLFEDASIVKVRERLRNWSFKHNCHQGISFHSVYRFACLSVRLSVCLSVCLSICLSFCLYVCLFVFCLSVYLPICDCLSVYMSARLCICLCGSFFLLVFLSA